jgi:methyl-accepting chemotaxis protein
MNPLFKPAALVINRLPYLIKVILMVSCGVIPACTFAWLEYMGSAAGAAKSILTVAAGIMLLCFVYVAAAYYFSLKHVLGNFQNVLDEMGNGNMMVRLEFDHKDEIGAISVSFNHMIEKFEALVQQISSATGQLAAAAEEMSTVARSADHNINRQTLETEQVATAMNEMSATVREVAQNAASAASAANNADNEAKGGKGIVTQTAKAIQQLADSVEQTAQVVHQLEADSETIGTVLDVIKDIAEQTNLLALNAAIEAARAGEQGRGFAVVADEVRTLASRTQSSTQEIQEMIERLQAGAANAVQAMEHGRSQAHAGAEQAREAAESLEAITKAVTTINEMNTMIASAAEEQNSVAEEMDKNIVNISQLSHDTAGAVEQTTAASVELSKLASQLESLVSQFKLSV